MDQHEVPTPQCLLTDLVLSVQGIKNKWSHIFRLIKLIPLISAIMATNKVRSRRICKYVDVYMLIINIHNELSCRSKSCSVLRDQL